MRPTKLNLISGNKNKVAEIQAILGDIIQIDNTALDLVEIQGTVEDVTRDKCRRAAEIVSHKTLD